MVCPGQPAEASRPSSSRPARVGRWRAIACPETLYRPPCVWDRAAVCCLVRHRTRPWSAQPAGFPCIPAHPCLSTTHCVVPSTRTVLAHRPRLGSPTGYRFGSPTSYASTPAPSGEAQHTRIGARNTASCPPSAYGGFAWRLAGHAIDVPSRGSTHPTFPAPVAYTDAGVTAQRPQTTVSLMDTVGTETAARRQRDAQRCTRRQGKGVVMKTTPLAREGSARA